MRDKDSSLFEENKDLASLIFENADVVLVLVNSEGKVAKINNSGVKMVGKEPRDILGLVGGEVFSCVNAWDDDMLVCGRLRQCEYCVVRENFKTTFHDKLRVNKAEGPFEIIREGKVYKIHLSVSTRIIEIDNEEFVLMTIDDISRTKESEQNAVEQRNLSQKYLQTAGVMIGALNSLGEITLMNKKGLEILGYQNEKEIIGKNWFDISLPKNIVVEVKKVFHLLMTGNIEPVEYYENPVITKAGEKRIIAFHNTVLHDNDDKINGVLFSGEDITERLEHEHIIKTQNDILTELNLSKDRFLSILAHDLKGPLGTAKGLIELLYKNLRIFDIDKIENHLRHVNDSTNHVYLLLEDLLSWANSQSNNASFNPQTIRFKELCDEVVGILQTSLDAKNIRISSQNRSSAILMADNNMLKSILLNLLSNAIKFSNENSEIRVSIDRDINSTIVSIADDGVGISKDDLTKLFDISEVHSTKGTANEKGTGIGLLICKEFIEKHGGKIWVKSEIGKGSDFVFSIPL